jgi:hypothetical protein
MNTGSYRGTMPEYVFAASARTRAVLKRDPRHSVRRRVDRASQTAAPPTVCTTALEVIVLDGGPSDLRRRAPLLP